MPHGNEFAADDGPAADEFAENDSSGMPADNEFAVVEGPLDQ